MTCAGLRAILPGGHAADDESTLGILAMLILVALSVVLMAPAARKVIGVNVDSIVHPVTVEIVGHAIEQAGCSLKVCGNRVAGASRRPWATGTLHTRGTGPLGRRLMGQ